MTADPADTALQSTVDASFDLHEGDLMTLFNFIVAHTRRIADGDIRAASAILRRWLCKGHIGRRFLMCTFFLGTLFMAPYAASPWATGAISPPAA